MTSTAKTAYQRTHAPTKRIEVKCTGRQCDVQGRCITCGRVSHATWQMHFTHDHKPNEIGSLGWVAHYGDGSTRYIGPKETP